MPKRPFDLPEPEIIAGPVQPEAAIAFWAWRTATPYDVVKRMDEGARQRAFYAAGLMERDAVQAVKDALGQMLEGGETLKDFQEQFADLIASQGWRGDRIETIFRNNVQSAYMAGRYAKMQEVEKARPYWQYITVGDERVRPSHAVLNGLVFHADHEFWAENYPPNGHKCRCGVRSLSARQVAREGLDVQDKMPGDSMYTDPKTGMEYHVARPGADDGWRNNPGKTWFESMGKAPGAGGVSGPATGLPLDKYPDLTPESYAQQRLRPAPVADYVELAQGISEKARGFLRNSTGVRGIALVNKRYFMATDSSGYFWLSSRAYTDPKMGKFVPHKHLKDAWNKLAEGKPLIWQEEYAIESFWHEIVHNRQKIAYTGGQTTSLTRSMEIVTQWTARRTYPEFLQSLGAKPLHLESIKKDGLGYGYYIKNFDRLVKTLKIDESALLQEMQRIIDTIPRDKYLDELSTFLARQTGQKKATIRRAIDKTRESKYDEELRALGLIQED
jgi:SPP1 gp7 family putative phage head morphogenesis protein